MGCKNHVEFSNTTSWWADLQVPSPVLDYIMAFKVLNSYLMRFTKIEKSLLPWTLPSHLNAVVHLLERTGCFSLIDLIYKHAIFGLYAPLFRESHRQKAITLMAEQRASGSVHLMLGLNVSWGPQQHQISLLSKSVYSSNEKCYGRVFLE